MYRIFRNIDGISEQYDIAGTKQGADAIVKFKNKTAPKGVTYYYEWLEQVVNNNFIVDWHGKV